MGWMESLTGSKPIEGGSSDADTSLRVSLRFVPLRLSAMQAGRVDLVVGLENTGSTERLVSVDSRLPQKEMLGFEPACISKTCENRVGPLAPGEKKDVHVGIWSNNQTRAGEYVVVVDIFNHYQDYTKVIHSVKRTLKLRVV